MEEPEVDHLYSLPLDQFTQARDALASRLKTAGDATEATRIKSMRKPTVPAWAVNQLARRYPKQVEALIAASDRLRRAQQDVLEGAPAGDLWEATLAERESVGELMKAAEWLLKEGGLGTSRAVLDRVSDTLYAAAADPTGRSLLRRGLITHEMRRAGFGDMIVPPAPTPGKAAARKGPSKAAPPKRGGHRDSAAAGATGATARQVLEAERSAQKAGRVAERAEEDADRMMRAADRADEESRQARKRADAAVRSAGDARAAADRARKVATDARKEAERADARLQKLRGRRR